MNTRNMNKLLLHPLPDNVTAFSTTRAAGGNGVHPWRVRENCRLVAGMLGISDDRLIVPRQTHTTNILPIDENFLQLGPEERLALLEEKDALVTHLPDVCVCVSTADCIPVLCYDARQRVVAVVHAGWRGTCGGIVRRTCDLLRQRYGSRGEDLHALIGPGISLESFEVGDEVYETFQAQGFDMDSLARRFPSADSPSGKWHIDLWECNRRQLLSFGVPSSQIRISGICTVQHADTFFSARRLGLHSGRILNGIIMR